MRALVLFIAFVFPLSVWAQAISTKIINAGGTTFSSTSGQLIFSIGEPVVASRIVLGQSFSQGFIQGLRQVLTSAQGESKVNIIAYPNPTVDRFYVTPPCECSVQLTDQTGRLLIVSQATKDGVDVSYLAQGSYIVQIQDLNGSIKASLKLLKL